MSTQTEVKKDTFKDTVLERTKLHGVQDKEGPTNFKKWSHSGIDTRALECTRTQQRAIVQQREQTHDWSGTTEITSERVYKTPKAQQ